jgi:predicted acyltransferase
MLTVTRSTALDTFRGLTMAGMVVVNNPGTWSAMYWPLRHAEWNGWTPTDLIFPYFLFIVGVSLTMSRKTVEAPVWRIVQRAAVIIFLGLFLTGFPRFDPQQWRFTGVLPRIALCYLAAALIYRWNRRPAVIASLALALILGYWLVLTRFGDLTPEGNIGAVLDRRVFGSHLYLRGRWDPEGLLSTVPAIATTLIGVLAGMWLDGKVALGRKLMLMAMAGMALMLAGQIWHEWLPINKNLWTSSYVLLTGGAAILALAACIYVVDVRGWRRWSHPFVVLGRNALALFVASGLIGKAFVVWRLQPSIYEQGFGWMAEPTNASLIYSLVFLAVMYAMCWALYKRRIFISA